MPSIFRRVLPAGLLVALVLGASACQLRVGVDVEVTRDGSGRLRLALAADRELRDRAAAAGADPLDEVAAAGAALRSDGWEVTDVTDAAGGREVALSTRFADPGEFDALAAGLAEALSAPEVRILDPMTLAVDADRITLTGGAGLVPTDLVTEAGLQPADAVRLAREQDAVAYRIDVRLPAEVLESTATRVQGSVLTWEIAPGERVELRAVGVRPGPPLLPLVGGALAGGATATAGVLVARRRRRRLRASDGEVRRRRPPAPAR